MRIGPHRLDPPLILAPMAGISDKPFRLLCRRLGASLAVSEMTTDEPRLWATRKSRLRMDHGDEPGPVSVQIAGHDPARLADAARYHADRGADLIDINMGCPAKKVCNVAAGSALLRDELLVARILAAVVAAVPVPVTLKIRTGYDRNSRNAPQIARLAEEAGIAAIAVHGRTRQDFFAGAAEHDSAALLKATVKIPVIVNGDIDSPSTARTLLERTGADALMVGRAARGRPRIFSEIAHFLATGTVLPSPPPAEVTAIILGHLDAMYGFYGEEGGVRVARKHLAWYCRDRAGGDDFRRQVNQVTTAAAQSALTADFLAGSAPESRQAA